MSLVILLMSTKTQTWTKNRLDNLGQGLKLCQRFHRSSLNAFTSKIDAKHFAHNNCVVLPIFFSFFPENWLQFCVITNLLPGWGGPVCLGWSRWNWVCAVNYTNSQLISTFLIPRPHPVPPPSTSRVSRPFFTISITSKDST